VNVPLPFWRIHGTLRGLNAVGRSTQFEGRFGRMFRTLPPASFTDAELEALAEKMVAEDEGAPTPETADPPDDEENVGPDHAKPAVPAGYTYLGQFIDHDLTFDPASSLQKANDPDALVDFRTPRFDLDNVYGRGPDDQPYLYQADGVRMQLGRSLTGNPADPKARDVPRTAPDAGPRRALIGDPRNDENVIVSQLQAAFLRFHNRVADVLNVTDPGDFPEVQKFVRWHYQWAVLHDFLPTLIDPATLHKVLPHLANGTSLAQDPPRLQFYKPKKEPFIPVEFSVAAYRFGHSMVRPIYRLSETVPPTESDGTAPDGRLPVFAPPPRLSLVGFDEFPSNWAVDWRLFFNVAPAPQAGKMRVQPAYKIDTSLVNPLGALPAAVAHGVPSLALRNLLRGKSMGLPSGQSVARALKIPVLDEDQLRAGKANADDVPMNPRLIDVSPAFEDNAPLWFYVLAESMSVFRDNDTPILLGPVGGTIVAEVFVGLMLGDQFSFLRQHPGWKPFSQFMNSGRFGIAELLAQAMQA
jgi:hypothetical protein